jgi:hypothetical protein
MVLTCTEVWCGVALSRRLLIQLVQGHPHHSRAERRAARTGAGFPKLIWLILYCTHDVSSAPWFFFAPPA